MLDARDGLIEDLMQASAPVFKVPRVVNGLNVSDKLFRHGTNIDAVLRGPTADTVEDADHAAAFVDEMCVLAVLEPLLKVSVV